MTYTGEFLNVNNILYRVTITTQTAGTPQTITMGETPVMLSQNGGELFQNIKPQSATIQILSTEDLSDLYTVADMTNTVVIEDVTNNITIFDGYITPNQYSQPYLWKNTVEIEAVDILSALIQKKYEVPTVGALRNSLRDVLLRYIPTKTILCDSAVYDFVKWQFKCDACLDKTVFEVITECMKTAGLTITSRNNIYYIFDNEITVNAANITWVNINTEATTTETNTPVNLVLENYCSEDQNIEIDATYNEITATADIEQYEDTIFEGEDTFPQLYEDYQPPFTYYDYSLSSSSDYSRHYTAGRFYTLEGTPYSSTYWTVNDVAEEYPFVYPIPSDTLEMYNVQNLEDYITNLENPPADYATSSDYYLQDIYGQITGCVRNPNVCSYDNSVKKLSAAGTILYKEYYGDDYPFTTGSHAPRTVSDSSYLVYYTGALGLNANLWKKYPNITYIDDHDTQDIVDAVYLYNDYPSFEFSTGTYIDYAVAQGKRGYITLKMDMLQAFGDGRGQQADASRRTITNIPKETTSEKYFGEDSKPLLQNEFVYPSQDYNAGVMAAAYTLTIGNKYWHAHDREWRDIVVGSVKNELYYYNSQADGTQNQKINLNEWMKLCNNASILNQGIKTEEGEAIIATVTDQDVLQGELKMKVWLRPLVPLGDNPFVHPLAFWFGRSKHHGEKQVWQLPNHPKYIKLTPPTVEYKIADYPVTFDTIDRQEDDSSSEDKDITYTITNTTDYDRPNEDLEFMLCSYREEIPFAKSYIIDPSNGLQITTVTDPYDGQTKRPEERVIQQYNRHYATAKYIYNVGVHGYFEPFAKVTATATGNREYVTDTQQYDIMHNANTAKLIEV